MEALVTQILGCATDPNGWEPTLDTFNDTFGVSASCTFSVHEFSNFRMDFAWSDYYRRTLTDDVLQMMTSGGDAEDQAGYATLFAAPPHQFYNEMELFKVANYDALPPSKVRAFTESRGFVMRSVSALNQFGPWVDGLFCHARHDAEWRALAADPRGKVILPIMGNSLSLARMLNTLRAQFRAALTILDALGLAVFLVDQRGAVIDKNAAAQDILASADGVALDATKRIRLHKSDQTQQLYTMIDQTNGLLRGEITPGPNTLAITRPSQDFDYLATVSPLSDTMGELETGFKSAIVTLIDPCRADLLKSDGLAMLGGLSDAERGVVDLLIQGLRPAQVADRRDVSLNTIKSQLKSISQKLRCSSQGDIVRAAAATRLPIIKH